MQALQMTYPDDTELAFLIEDTETVLANIQLAMTLG